MNQDELEVKLKLIQNPKIALDNSRRLFLLYFAEANRYNDMIKTFQRNLGKGNELFKVLEQILEKERDKAIEQGLKQHGIFQEQKRFLKSGATTRGDSQT